MPQAYFALRTRIDRFADSVRARYGEQIVCRPGCTSCCQGGLTVVMVEAVIIGQSLGISEERIQLQAGQPPLRSEGRCTLLDANDFCSVYSARPLICRTHGLPIKYAESEEIIVCEQNFLSEEPHETAVLDATNMEKALFAVNLDYCRKRGLNPMARVALDRIAEIVKTLPGK